MVRRGNFPLKNSPSRKFPQTTGNDLGDSLRGISRGNYRGIVWVEIFQGNFHGRMCGGMFRMSDEDVRISGSPCRITSLYVQRLWVVPSGLTHRHTQRQLLTGYTLPQKVPCNLTEFDMERCRFIQRKIGSKIVRVMANGPSSTVL